MSSVTVNTEKDSNFLMNIAASFDTLSGVDSNFEIILIMGCTAFGFLLGMTTVQVLYILLDNQSQTNGLVMIYMDLIEWLSDIFSSLGQIWNSFWAVISKEVQ